MLRKRFMNMYKSNIASNAYNEIIVLGDLVICDANNSSDPGTCNGMICFRKIGDDNVISNTTQPIVYHYGDDSDPIKRIVDLISPLVIPRV